MLREADIEGQVAAARASVGSSRRADAQSDRGMAGRAPVAELAGVSADETVNLTLCDREFSNPRFHPPLQLTDLKFKGSIFEFTAKL